MKNCLECGEIITSNFDLCDSCNGDDEFKLKQKIIHNYKKEFSSEQLSMIERIRASERDNQEGPQE